MFTDSHFREGGTNLGCFLVGGWLTTPTSPPVYGPVSTLDVSLETLEDRDKSHGKRQGGSETLQGSSIGISQEKDYNRRDVERG